MYILNVIVKQLYVLENHKIFIFRAETTYEDVKG